MSVTLAPRATPGRIAVLIGESAARVGTVFEQMYDAGVDLRQYDSDRVLAAVQCLRAGHSVDAVELVLRWPYIGESAWLTSNRDDARIFPNLLQAVAFIDQSGATTYHLSPVGLMLRGQY